MTRKKKHSEVMWAVKGPEGFAIWGLRSDRKTCVHDFLWSMNKLDIKGPPKWEIMHKQGYRCVKVKVTEL